MFEVHHILFLKFEINVVHVIFNSRQTFYDITQLNIHIFFLLKRLFPYIQDLRDELAQLRNDSVAAASTNVVPLDCTRRMETELASHVACNRVSYLNIPAGTVVAALAPPPSQREDALSHVAAVSLRYSVFCISLYSYMFEV